MVKQNNNGCLQRINSTVYDYVMDHQDSNETFSQTLVRLLFHIKVNPVFDEMEMQNRILRNENEALKENKKHLEEIIRLRKRMEED